MYLHHGDVVVSAVTTKVLGSIPGWGGCTSFHVTRVKSSQCHQPKAPVKNRTWSLDSAGLLPSAHCNTGPMRFTHHGTFS